MFFLISGCQFFVKIGFLCQSQCPLDFVSGLFFGLAHASVLGVACALSSPPGGLPCLRRAPLSPAISPPRLAVTFTLRQRSAIDLATSLRGGLTSSARARHLLCSLALRGPAVRGLRKDFELSGDLLKVSVFAKFLMKLIEGRGLINMQGKEFFKPGWLNGDGKPVFNPPNGCFELVYQSLGEDMEEVAADAEDLPLHCLFRFPVRWGLRPPRSCCYKSGRCLCLSIRECVI